MDVNSAMFYARSPLLTVTGTEGTALTYFRVNESPSLGNCDIRPNPEDGPGVEMETVYSIFCQEWKDQVGLSPWKPSTASCARCGGIQ